MQEFFEKNGYQTRKTEYTLWTSKESEYPPITQEIYLKMVEGVHKGDVSLASFISMIIIIQYVF